MPNKIKRTYGPPQRVWVVVDVTSGNPVLVMKDPPEPGDLMDEEAIYEFELRKAYGK